MIEDPSELPVRSASGMAALDVFYSGLNDINFYVEDALQENLYSVILRKLFKSVKITRIFPLGGKRAVFQHALSGDTENIDGFRAYLVDRDFDHLLGNSFEHPNVFYLDKFCIENHLLEPAAAVEVVVENNPKARREEIENKLFADSQISACLASLRPLFGLFFCAQSFGVGIRNCSSVPEAFCQPKRLWKLKQNAITEYRKELKDAAIANGINSELFESRCDLWLSTTAQVSDHQLVSGKFVASMLFHYIKSKYKLGTMTFESFAYRSAKNSSLVSMRKLASRVRLRRRAHMNA